jgi:hypothetical protein
MASSGVARLWQAAFRHGAARGHELAAGAALLTCVAVVLNVGPFAPNAGRHVAPAQIEQAIAATAIAPDVGTDSDARRVQTDGPPVAEPIAPSLDVPSALTRLASLSDVAPARPTFPPVAAIDADNNVQPGSVRQDVLAPEPTEQSQAAIVGIWAPDAGTCSARNFREGLLPAIINTEGAWAGETFCTFKNQKQTDTDWRAVATCSNPREHWTAHVRLTVKGNRLTWTSRRGTQAYTRCAPNVLMAEAR